jgi:hypothetical protein
MEGLEGGIRYSAPTLRLLFPFFMSKTPGAPGVYGRRARLPKNLKVFAKRVRFAIGVVKLGRYARRALSTPATTARRVTGVALLFDENHKIALVKACDSSGASPYHDYFPVPPLIAPKNAAQLATSAQMV